MNMSAQNDDIKICLHTLGLHVWKLDRFLEYSVSRSFFLYIIKAKRRKKNFKTGDPKKNQTQVTSLTSDTSNHCTTAF